MNDPLSLPADLAPRLLDHYDRHRRTLPWRDTRDPYAIWVSEIMLQQTTVAAVIPYYARFMERLPTLQRLAAADLDTVLGLWQGLGYYQRARNLHRAARRVVAEMHGQLPAQRETLLSLPGIGPTTGHAILAIAFDQSQPILDGNVKRVLARLLALEQPLTEPLALRQLWEWAGRLTPRQRPGDYAQAIMDLGATLCSPRDPQCQCCPWSQACRARARGTPEAFPVPRRRSAPKPRLVQVSLILLDPSGRVLLLQRPAEGLLGGLWEPPATEPGPEPPRQPLALLQHSLGLGFGPVEPLAPVRHTFTHFQLRVEPWRAPCPGGVPQLGSHLQYRWVAPESAAWPPLATLHRKVLARGFGG
ncbi:MAG: A/G-specific adenine glycosylase [Magnetococcales bacterium]|nr:A/G-specific adenine glycosylase [Magnetococcales bacterium]